MLVKSNPDELQSFLSDASYLAGGHAARVVFPETAEEAADVLREASNERTPVTISGAGTGTVAGRVPFGGVLIATDRLNQIKSMVREERGGRGVCQAGVVLHDFQKFVEARGMIYPPDPTERNCFVGGTVATNASGARSFKYGPTRRYVRRMEIALATGDVLRISRGELRASDGDITIPLPSGRVINARLPSYRMPNTSKHAAGYYVAPEMDVLDLFIGSEGTLGVICEVELDLLPKPEGVLSGIVFFASERELLSFVAAVRNASLETRAKAERSESLVGGSSEWRSDIDARALEYFDGESLTFLRQKYDSIPAEAVGAVFFEQETGAATEDVLMDEWLVLLEQHQALSAKSWFATTEADRAQLKEFRHQLPVLMNEWFARHEQRKVSTDMAVAVDEFPGMLRFYQENLRPSGLRYTIFGHIGDSHVHVNILPRNDAEAERARAMYVQFVKRAIAVGGTVSAEHGIGKLKQTYLEMLYGERHLREMVALKRAFDPAGILGRGNMFSEKYLDGE